METLTETETIAEITEQPKAQPVSAREVLRIANFRLLWLGQIVSDFGSSLTNLTLLVLVNQLTGSTAALALMGIVLALPQLTFGLLAGVYVDRLDRKRIMLASDLLRGFLVLGFIMVGSKDSLWLLYVVAFAQATIGTFFTPARSALLPNLVPAEGLLTANSLSQTSSIMAGVLGTTIAGVIIGTLNSYWLTFTIDALTFFVSFALISQIKIAQQHTERKVEGGGAAFFAEFAAGMRVIGRSRVLVGVLTSMAVTMLGFGAINILVVPFILNDLQVPATWFGVTEFFQTAGMVISGALVAVVATRFKTTNIITVSLLLLGLLVALVALVSAAWQFVVILFLIGLSLMPLQAAVATITQTAVSDDLRGRVGATLNTVATSANLISMAFAGLLGTAIGIRNVFILSGAIAVGAGLFSALFFRNATPAPTPSEQPKLESSQPAL